MYPGDPEKGGPMPSRPQHPYPDLMASTLTALLKSTHPGPSVAVSAITAVLAIGVGWEAWRVAVIGCAMLVGQASVGLSNDWIDADRDRAVGRTDKPVATGAVSARVARDAAIGCAIVAVALTIPLGWAATLAHVIFIASAWSYNLGLKNSAASVLPYVVSFGMLPLVVTLAGSRPGLASPWALLAGATLGIAAHFANVLPDLDDDRATGIRGLPHRLGLRATGAVIGSSLAIAAAAIVFGLQRTGWLPITGFALSVGVAAWCATLVFRGRLSRLVFRLIIVGAVVDVMLLATAGQRILA